MAIQYIAMGGHDRMLDENTAAENSRLKEIEQAINSTWEKVNQHEGKSADLRDHMQKLYRERDQILMARVAQGVK